MAGIYMTKKQGDEYSMYEWGAVQAAWFPVPTHWMDLPSPPENSETNHERVDERIKYIPVTPGGTPCMWLESKTEEEAWSKLMVDAAHMPYRNKDDFIGRGYTVEIMTDEDE